jgi:DNA end-binding protein Ku
VVPENDAQAEAFATVRQALLKTKKVAIGKIAFSGREHIIAIAPAGTEGGGMLGYTLRYQAELRSQSDYFKDIKEQKINAESLEMTEALTLFRGGTRAAFEGQHGGCDLQEAAQTTGHF